MINSIKINSGVISDLGIFPKEIHFHDGVNIIYSPNGSGKSIFLKSISHRFPISYPKPLDYPMEKDSWNEYVSKDINNLEIDYNGGIVYLFDNFSIQDSGEKFNKAQSKNSDISFKDAVLELMTKPSSGQKIIQKVNSFSNLPTTIQFPKLEGNDSWQQCQQNFIDFYSQFPKDSKPTLLFDELDASLDPDKGLMFLDSVLSQLAIKFQIICVTHNPLVLLFDWYRIHNFYKDSSKELLYKMNWLFEKYKKNHPQNEQV